MLLDTSFCCGNLPGMNEDTVGDRIIRIAETNPALAPLTRKALAKKFGVSYETLRKWVEGKAAPSRRRADVVASALHVPIETFMHGVIYLSEAPDLIVVDESHRSMRVAQTVSHRTSTVEPKSGLPTVNWGDKSMLAANERFSVVAPDDSMAPIILQGMKVVFDRSFAPRNKDTVLIEDASGDWYIRTYRQAPNGRWEAKPEHGDYVTMDSERDGLTVLAVFDGTVGRRG